MKTLKEILENKKVIEIGGESFKLHYNNWALINFPFALDIAKFTGASKEKIYTLFKDIGGDAINLILSGIITDIIVKHNDSQAFNTNLLSSAAQQKVEDVLLYLKTGADTPELIKLFMVCVNSLVDFMPTKGGELGGESPPTPPRAKK